MGLAKAVYRGRQAEGRPGSSTGDWAAAERLLLQETFARGMGCSLSLVSALKVRDPSFLLYTASISLVEGGAVHEQGECSCSLPLKAVV